MYDCKKIKKQKRKNKEKNVYKFKFTGVFFYPFIHMWTVKYLNITDIILRCLGSSC